jgi:hypothetical protein
MGGAVGDLALAVLADVSGQLPEPRRVVVLDRSLRGVAEPMAAVRERRRQGRLGEAAKAMLEASGVAIEIAADREAVDRHLPPVALAAPLFEPLRVPALLALGDRMRAAVGRGPDAGARQARLVLAEVVEQR